MILQALLFSSCTIKQKELYVTKPFEFQKIKPPNPITIRVHKDDVKKYKDYILLLRKGFKFYEKQIDLYYKTFKDYKGVKL